MASAFEAEDSDASDASEGGSSSSRGLVHESVKAKGPNHPVKRYVPDSETPTDRNRRTVFVGNLPVTVAQSKVNQHPLDGHVAR